MVEDAVAARTLAGQPESGDRHIVVRLPDRTVLAVVDGLGHGEEAASAARLAVATVEAYAAEPVVAVLERCDEHLRRTRGVTMSVAMFSALDGMMTWAGVGNVEGVLVRADPRGRPQSETLLLRGGVVGRELPALRTAGLSIEVGDTLILATDGVRSGFMDGIDVRDRPRQIADRILERYGKGTDDALVLVARYLDGAFAR